MQAWWKAGLTLFHPTPSFAISIYSQMQSNARDHGTLADD